MTRGDYANEIPQEARDFKAPSDKPSEIKTETQPDTKVSSAVGNAEPEPTEEQLAPYRNQNKEEWEAGVAKWKEEEADREKQRAEKQERSNEKWRQKTQAMESVQVTGDPVVDAQGWLQARGMTIGELHPTYQAAFANSDRDGVLEYLKMVADNEGIHSSGSNSEAASEFWHRSAEVAREMISAAEARDSRKTTQ